ncbi:hypothetical protein BCON_0266g00030 [Botryotinia convoluta]|uniref:Uncharacterized protein n=1 Tax=Botryotinia convoluta TaxID=54673 RepID=A0A4Z1HEY1_9HELO|nr:hypothetical protein BCON_0266g00030 [Botryotinia convoluta]
MASSSSTSNRSSHRQAQRTDASIPQQIKELAFNVRGSAIEDGFPNRGVKTVICATEKRVSQYTEMKARIQKGEISLLRDSSDFTDREMGMPEAGMARYLIVGYVVLEDDEKKKHDHGEVKKMKPILVVTEVTAELNEGGQMRYWALMQPQNSICTLCSVKADNVYFLWEFRDFATSVRDRRKNWGNLVAQAAHRPDLLDEPSQRQVEFKRGKQTKLVFEPKISLANHLLLLSQSFLETPNDAILKDMEAALYDAVDDLQMRPSHGSENLRSFCELERDITKEEAQAVVLEVERYWPEINGLTWEIVRTVKRGLIQSGMELQYRLLRALLAEATSVFCGSGDIEDRDGDEKMEEGETPQGSEFGSKVEKILQTAERMIPLPTSTQSLLNKSDRTIIGAIAVKLKEISKAFAEGDKELLDHCGDCALEQYSIYDIWGKYAEAVDTDPSKMAFMTIVRRLMMHLLRKNRGGERHGR